jgi:hypothetical protein
MATDFAKPRLETTETMPSDRTVQEETKAINKPNERLNERPSEKP